MCLAARQTRQAGPRAAGVMQRNELRKIASCVAPRRLARRTPSAGKEHAAGSGSCGGGRIIAPPPPVPPSVPRRHRHIDYGSFSISMKRVVAASFIPGLLPWAPRSPGDCQAARFSGLRNNGILPLRQRGGGRQYLLHPGWAAPKRNTWPQRPQRRSPNFRQRTC